MIKKYQGFRQINEEVGVRKMKSIADFYSEAEIYFHMDLDGVTSALAMKYFIERYDIDVVDAHIIQYGNIEYAVKNTEEGRMPVLVDFAHSKPFFVIATDHHDKQTGADTNPATYFKPSRSNVETISGEISPSDAFTSTDIELIKMVDSADFLKYDIKPEDIQNAVFKYKKELTPQKNRFLMGLVVNRLLLVFKSKRITVKSLDGKRDHINRNLLECLVLDSTPSLHSIFNNLRHYINNAISQEWSMSTRSHNTPMRLATPEQMTSNLMNYIETRKLYTKDEEGNLTKHKDIDFIEDYNIVRQYGIGSVFKAGSYDRYIVFKNFPKADFVCTIFPMGLIQVSCNPFKEKALKQVNLGEIAKEVLSKFKYQLSNINISISDIKRINEDEVKKMKERYGQDYQAIGFNFSDLKAFYKDAIIALPNRRQGDSKTRVILNLDDENNQDVQLLEEWMDIPYEEWSNEAKQEISWLKIPIWNIIEESSGGHPSITNIQGLNYLSCRKDLLRILFKTENYTDVMKLIADTFINVMQEKIDAAKKGRKVEYDTKDVNLKSSVIVENFEYFIRNDNEKIAHSVSKEEFVEFGMTNNFEPKKDNEKGFKMDINDNIIIGYYESYKINESYVKGDKFIAKRDYLDLFKSGEEYEIYDIENNLGDTMYYVSHNGKKISGWGLKEFELKIQFDQKS